ncbi:hypothetical protein KA057_00180 [Candidatus Gracilibacteria bacterium]|nr:hypothetical protein [Candidatus Gracilibacteria bacterium]
MHSDTHITDKLAQENQELREKLAIAEQWIGRELSEIRFRKMKEEAKKQTKHGLSESEQDIEERGKKYLGDSYSLLSHENRELLIESEINFSHLIRQKDIDGLIVANAYQKILENLFEEHITKIFRETYKKSRLHPKKNDLLEKTIYKVIQNDFHLSLGKIYLILQRGLQEDTGDLIALFRESAEKQPLYNALSHGEFWEYFSDIIETGAFGEKRHAGKITLKDVRFLREKITGNFEKEGFLKIILDYIK